jgi:hypothetical protein
MSPRSFICVVIIASGFAAQSSAALAASPGFCANYANTAVRQFERSRRCFGGMNAMWQPNYQAHFGWCLRVSEGAAFEQDAIRRARLRDCGY